MKFKKTLALIIAILLLVSGLVGCSQSGANKNEEVSSEKTSSSDKTQDKTQGKTTTFKLLMGSRKTWDEPMSADPVGQYITEKTGVYLDVELITGDASERFALVLASNDYPDFMVWPGDALASQFISAGALIAYDEYFNLLPNVVSRFKNSIGGLYDIDTKHMYRIPQWTMGDTLQINIGLSIRHDIMEEYFGERASVNNFILMSEIEDFFKWYKEKNPASYPLTTNGEGGLFYYMCQPYGIPQYWEDGENAVGIYYTHEKTPDIIRTLNRWYNLGILDPEFAMNKLENMQEKLSTGSSIAVWCHESQISKVNQVLEAEDPNKYLFSYYKVTESIGNEAYYKYSSIGSGGLCVTKACSDIETAMKFINFMNDPEVMFILCNGLPGTFWDYGADGKVVPNYEAVKAIPELWDRFRKVGAYKYIWMLSEGRDNRFTAYNDDYFKIIHGEGQEIPKENLGRKTFWNEKEDNLLDPTLFQGILPPSESKEGIIQAKITDIWDYAFPEMIMASSENEAIEIYNKAIKEMYDAGLKDFLDAVAKKYYIKKDLMGLK